MEKNIINRILLTLVSLLFITSCADKEITMIENEEAATIVMDLSTESLYLDQNYINNPALTLSWSAASYGAPVEINYRVEASKTGDFTDAYVLGTYAKSVNYATFNVNQMNNAALGVGLTKDTAGTLYMRVVSYVGDNKLSAVSNITSLQVTPYQKIYPTYYLVGEASYVGWSADKAQELYKYDNMSYIYTYLEPEAFRFLGQQAWDPTNYSISEDWIDSSKRYFTSYTESLLGKFTKADGSTDAENIGFTGTSGIYKIAIDSDKKSLTVSASAISEYDVANLYLVGTMNGWSDTGAIAMTRTSAGVFEYTTTLDDASKFKFLGQQSWSGTYEWGNILSDNEGHSGFLGPKGDDSNIAFDGGGNTYKITVNLQAGTYTIVQQ